MKLLLSIVALVFVNASLFGQESVKWTAIFDREKSEIIVTATIPKGWHMYSTTQNPESGPLPTSFIFPKGNSIHVNGALTETPPHEFLDPVFEAMVKSYDGFARFTQPAHTHGSGTYSFTVNYMMCNESMCLPPRDEQLTITY